MSAIPIKLREAIVQSHEQGLTYAQVAELLGVGQATVNRVLRLKRETGGVVPRPAGGGWRSPIHGRLADLLQAIVRELPDATVAELTEALMKRGGTRTSRSAVQRALARLGFSRKKRRSWQANATPPSTARGGVRSART